jgi:hypothetical protein
MLDIAENADCARDSRSVFRRRIHCLSAEDFSIDTHLARSKHRDAAFGNIDEREQPRTWRFVPVGGSIDSSKSADTRTAFVASAIRC